MKIFYLEGPRENKSGLKEDRSRSPDVTPLLDYTFFKRSDTFR